MTPICPVRSQPGGYGPIQLLESKDAELLERERTQRDRVGEQLRPHLSVQRTNKLRKA